MELTGFRKHPRVRGLSTQKVFEICSPRKFMPRGQNGGTKQKMRLYGAFDYFHLLHTMSHCEQDGKLDTDSDTLIKPSEHFRIHDADVREIPERVSCSFIPKVYKENFWGEGTISNRNTDDLEFQSDSNNSNDEMPWETKTDH